MKQSIAVVLSYDPRFDTMDAVLIPDPSDEAASPSDQIYGIALLCLEMVSNSLIDWWLSNKTEAAG